jgi:hypothetical protein
MTTKLTQEDLDTLTNLVAKLIEEKQELEAKLSNIEVEVKRIIEELQRPKKNWPYTYVTRPNLLRLIDLVGLTDFLDSLLNRTTK